MSILTRPILEISIEKLISNFKYLSSMSKGAISASVVKDNAYGIGAVEVASALYNQANCRHFFVAHAVEAERIYPFVKDASIYVLQGIGEDSLELFQKLKLIPVISSPEQLAFWNSNKIKDIKPALQIDTGLNRLGFREQDLADVNINEQDFSLLMSHLSCADIKDHFLNNRQLEKFKSLKQQYFPNTPASLAASDGVFLGKDFDFDMVRLGAAVYGINTVPYRQNIIQNIIKIKAPILQISTLDTGDFAGYDASYKAMSKRKIAIVSIGYGDGLPRILSNTGKVFFGHESAPIIGRISMDNTICDITNIPNLSVGDLATIVDDFYTIDDLGTDAQTIGYEILSRFGKNPRFAFKYA